MRLKRQHPSNLLLAGLIVIAFGWAMSAAMCPSEALIPITGVIAGLTLLTSSVNSGPTAFR